MKSQKGVTSRMSQGTPILPVRNAVLYPHLVISLAVGRPSSMAAVDAAMATEEKIIVIVAQKNSATESPALQDLYSVGTKAMIKKVTRQKKQQSEIVVQGLERVRITSLGVEDGFLSATVQRFPLAKGDNPEYEALRYHYGATGQGTKPHR